VIQAFVLHPIFWKMLALLMLVCPLAVATTDQELHLYSSNDCSGTSEATFTPSIPIQDITDGGCTPGVYVRSGASSTVSMTMKCGSSTEPPRLYVHTAASCPIHSYLVDFDPEQKFFRGLCNERAGAEFPSSMHWMGQGTTPLSHCGTPAPTPPPTPIPPTPYQKLYLYFNTYSCNVSEYEVFVPETNVTEGACIPGKHYTRHALREWGPTSAPNAASMQVMCPANPGEQPKLRLHLQRSDCSSTNAWEEKVLPIPSYVQGSCNTVWNSIPMNFRSGANAPTSIQWTGDGAQPILPDCFVQSTSLTSALNQKLHFFNNTNCNGAASSIFTPRNSSIVSSSSSCVAGDLFDGVSSLVACVGMRCDAPLRYNWDLTVYKTTRHQPDSYVTVDGINFTSGSCAPNLNGRGSVQWKGSGTPPTFSPSCTPPTPPPTPTPPTQPGSSTPVNRSTLGKTSKTAARFDALRILSCLGLQFCSLAPF